MRQICLRIAAVLFAATLAKAETPAQTFEDYHPAGLQYRLLEGDFDELEEMAANYIKTRARYRGGYWVIVDFYDILTKYDAPNGPCREEWKISFEEKRAAIERWMAARPNSQTARIALAWLWSRYASTERGCRFANQTSDDQFKAFHDDLARARELLKPVDFDSNPEAYVTAVKAALADEDPRPEQARLFDRALLAFPTLSNIATARYYYLLPRWYGAPGEAGAFAKSLLTAPGGETGLEFYFDVARTALAVERDYQTLLSVSVIDYSTLAKAFAARAAKYGPMTSDMNVMLYYAVAARDLNTTLAV